MAAENGQRRLAAILVADVVGYSSQIAADEAGALTRLRVARDAADALIAEHQGRVFKTTGDGFLAEFASAVQALRCAIAIQTQLRSDDLKLRMGLHQGDVIAQNNDLLGDGVNIAARLEPLAEPGGICISARVHEDALGKIALDASDMGEQALKNIARPVRVYRVRLDPPERPALALPDKPSIAVLPFLNMSGDPEQEYFADGMVEEIITALSRVRWFFVIARNSSFAYKGKSPDVRQVARELGVRYVLEGSVRKAGGRVRIACQLVDATTGANVWADRFEETLADIFDLQDRVTASAAAAIEPKLRGAEIERAQRKQTENLQAYDLFLRAACYFQRARASLPDSEAAIQLLSEAVKLDPSFAIAHAWMAEYYWGTAAQVRREPPDPWALKAVKSARTALSLGGDDPEVLWRTAATIAAPGGNLDEALALVEKSLALNPNSVGAFYQHARLLAYLGDTEAAIAELQRAARLSPVDIRPYRIEFDYTMTHFIAGRYDAALEWSERALRSMPRYPAALRYKTASLGLLGRIEEGHQAVQQLLAVTPGLTVIRARAHIEIGMNNVFRTPGFADRLCEGLRRAGLPEA